MPGAREAVTAARGKEPPLRLGLTILALRRMRRLWHSLSTTDDADYRYSVLPRLRFQQLPSA
jgi:hypothetical protein